MARETNSVSERAARRQRREQAAAAAAEVNESNWTTVVEVTATPKRAVVLATPDADARGALATDAGVPNAGPVTDSFEQARMHTVPTT